MKASFSRHFKSSNSFPQKWKLSTSLDVKRCNALIFKILSSQLRFVNCVEN